jgi:chromosome segregation ATPase
MPSPFYFFDEVDAALDTMNAGRVAEYMARGGQVRKKNRKKHAGSENHSPH